MNNDIKEILDRLRNCDYDDFNKVLDYITNLQEENKILRQNAEHNDKVVDKARWNEMLYKGRNKKAIEYIKEHQRKDEFLNLNEWQTRDLLNILEGDDKE